MVKPKLIIDAAVRIHAIKVRLCASHVRSKAIGLLSSETDPLLIACLHIRLDAL